MVEDTLFRVENVVQMVSLLSNSRKGDFSDMFWEDYECDNEEEHRLFEVWHYSTSQLLRWRAHRKS